MTVSTNENIVIHGNQFYNKISPKANAFLLRYILKGATVTILAYGLTFSLSQSYIDAIWVSYSTILIK